MSQRPRISRLFFACWPEPRIRERIAALIPVRGRDAGSPVAFGNIHLTLVFLGSVGPDQHHCLENMAAEIRGEAFVLSLDELGYWKRSRILWLGSSRTPRALLDLVAALHAGIRRCGFVPETRPYAAHVTLARKTRRRPRQGTVDCVQWPVKKFVLVESTTSAAGPRYEVLQCWSLGL